MKKLIVFFIGLIFFSSYAQLDETTVMGIPTGTSAEINGVTPEEEGAIAYNSETKKLMVYTDTGWVNVSISENGWLTTGNSGITASDFIGTTDGQDLVLKANNDEQLRLNGSVEGQVLINEATEFNSHPLVVRANGVDVLAFEDESGTPKWHWNLLADGLNFVESNVLDYRLFLKNGGNVGIGTNDPLENLHIANNMRLNGSFVDKDGDKGTSGQVLSSTVSGTDWVDKNSVVSVNPLTNSYTLVSSDNGSVITIDNSNDTTLTIPSGLAIGFNISLYQIGDGQVTIIGDSGVTVLNRLRRFTTAGKDAGVGIVCTATNTFHITGDLKR
ncbi:hypothetical protein ACFQ5N_11680 [Lutibacter holmesii]|uniref:Uncharacterized protein n=1 Tax=Lutibacter holmesii TaxID=1137985 RepID=A0ABW3WQR1_9FLAO